MGALADRGGNNVSDVERHTQESVASPVAGYGPDLPAHLRSIKRIHADPEILALGDTNPVLQLVRRRLPTLPWISGAPHSDRDEANDGHTLYLKHYKGQFLRFCPATRYYRCCGYRIAHVGENCPVGCTYCILQAYFQDQVLKVWANQGDLFEELGKGFSANPSTQFRIGTGEFTDSLALEPLTGYARNLAEYLEAFDNVVLELKSKIVDLSWMAGVTRTDRVLPAWSMNAPRIVQEEEGLASSLEERLAAAQQVAADGFRVCLHFDPIIHYEGWKSGLDGYAATVDMIFDHLTPEQIAYVSLGSFRFMPDLKQAIERNHPKARYIYNEFIPGRDNKQRLLRPLRVEQFQFIVERLRRGGLDKELYFCMESDTVWQAVMGRTPLEFGGLTEHLLELAFSKT